MIKKKSKTLTKSPLHIVSYSPFFIILQDVGSADLIRLFVACWHKKNINKPGT